MPEVDAGVPPPPPSRLARGFAVLVARRRLVLAIWAVLLAPSVWFAAQVRQDNSIDRLIVPEDPDYVATRSFQQVFGAGEFALLLAEADDASGGSGPPAAKPNGAAQSEAERQAAIAANRARMQAAAAAKK